MELNVSRTKPPDCLTVKMTELHRAIIEQLFEQFKLILKAILSEPKASLFPARRVKAYQQVNYPQMLRESLWIFVDTTRCSVLACVGSWGPVRGRLGGHVILHLKPAAGEKFVTKSVTFSLSQ
jgi:hypothetical protein